MIKCFFCDLGPADGVTVYRLNPKGEEGVWACEIHRPASAPHIDPAIKEIVQAIEDAS